MKTRLRAAALAIGAALLASPAARPASAADAPVAEEGTFFSVDVLLDAVAVDGTFPVSVETGPAPAEGTLRVDTDARGRLSGTLDVAGRTLAVSGRAVRGRQGVRVAFTARSGRDRIVFSGTLGDQVVSGRATGRGAVLPGRHPFTLDLSSAPPKTARIDCRISESARGRVGGSARVTACGDELPLTVSGRRGRRSLTLRFASRAGFRFSGAAEADGSLLGDLLLDWRARGFGGSAAGEDLLFPVLAPPTALAYGAAFAEVETGAPIDPLAPVAGSTPQSTFTVEPALPAGLAIDAATGTISGTPTEIRDTASYSVTAANYAGSAETAIDLRVRISRALSFDPETREPTDDDLRHFLVRTQFGATDAALDRLKLIGLEAYVDDMLNFVQNGPAESVAFPELVNVDDLGVVTDPPGLEGKFPSAAMVQRWWTSLMMHTDNPFQERLAFFWHDHFAASTEVLDSTQMHFMVGHVNLWRYEGNGNLRDLLVKMARDPAMLVYLDGFRNTRSAPNENFAREFWELFTLGVDNGYTQEDIVEAARAFTGYRARTDETTGLGYFTFETGRHDAESKTVLGQTIPGQNATDDYEAVVDITLARGQVAEFIARKLFEHFAYERPPQQLVDRMAAELRAADWELRPFLRSLFLSEAFFSPAARRNLVKSPVDFAVGFIQSTGLKIRVDVLRGNLTNLGQVPTRPPTVNGWPIGELWLSAQNMVDRTNLVYTCIEDTARQAAYDPPINVADILPPVEERTAENVVDSLATLLRVDLREDERQKCVDFLNSTATGSATSPTVVVSPFDGSSQTVLDERVRGLLYVLVQHPSYHLR